VTAHRPGGVALLVLAIGLGSRLAQRAANWPGGVTALDLLLIALACLAASAGLALLLAGAALTAPLALPVPGCRCRTCQRLRLRADP